METNLHIQKLSEIFQARPDIIAGVKREADCPERIDLFNNIMTFVSDQILQGGEPASKKRKLESSQANGGNRNATASASGNAADETILLSVKDISVSAPVRKKLDLCFTKSFLYARAAGSTTPVQGTVHPYKEIEYAFFLPVPEKTQLQHNYVLFPRGTSLPSRTNPDAEPLVFTVPATAPKEGSIGGSEAGEALNVSDEYQSLFHWAFNKRFKAAGYAINIISANSSKFHSVIRQAHRPKEKAVHVTAFRGSKDGYLFFLDNGILWAFKKPLIFMPLDRIAAVSYVNVLQITFNMVVEVFNAYGGNETEEIEFGMLDQQDYSGIDNYIKQNRLQDRSLAEQRRGKIQLAENKAAKGSTDGALKTEDDADEQANDGMTDLQRAEQEAEEQLQDQEDEEEEDYDPGSAGESEGSGASSEEEEEEPGDEGDTVKEESDEEEDGYEEERPEEQDDAKPIKAEMPRAQGWAAFGKPPSGGM